MIDPMFAAPKLFGHAKPSATERKVLTLLLERAQLVDLGKIGSRSLFALTRGSSDETLLQFATDWLRSRAQGRFALYEATPAAFRKASDLPKNARAKLPDALKDLISSGEAFTAKSGTKSFYALRHDLESALRFVPREPQATLVPQEVAERVRDAYRAVRRETGRRSVLISDVYARSQVPLSSLHSFLDTECTQHRANPSRGEPTAASQQQLEAALPLAGQPYLYIELLE